MSTWLRHWLLALQFFTRVPVTGRLAAWVGYSPAMLRASAAHYPGIGWLVGAVGAAVMGGLLVLLPPTPFAPLVAAVFGTVATVLFTGALHEDGLADVADGLGGAFDRQRALEIMKDSRIGSYGALAVALALAAKVALLAHLAALAPGLACAALLLAHPVSRAWPLLQIRFLRYVGDAAGSKAKPMADAIGAGALAWGAAWSLAAVLLAAAWIGLAPVVAALLASTLAFGWTTRLYRRRLQGFTGDCLGATQQVTEIACYLGLALAA